MSKSSSIPGKVYKYVHKQDETIKTNLVGRSFKNDWLEIYEDGTMILKGSHAKGYAWDGCSPKMNFIDVIWGTPDGRFDYKTEKQITYYASMFHDVLYQFKSQICISRKESDLIFKVILLKHKFRLTAIYFSAVRLFGGFFGKWKTKDTASAIIISQLSWLES